MAARAVLKLASVDGVRYMTVNSSFFTGYKQTTLKPNEVLVSVVIPFTSKVGISLFCNSESMHGAIPLVPHGAIPLVCFGCLFIIE